MCINYNLITYVFAVWFVAAVVVAVAVGVWLQNESVSVRGFIRQPEGQYDYIIGIKFLRLWLLCIHIHHHSLFCVLFFSWGRHIGLCFSS